MKYRSESILLLACAALVSACGGPDGDNSEAPSPEAAEQDAAGPASNDMPDTAPAETGEASADHEEEDDDHAHEAAEGGRLESHEHGHAMLAVTLQDSMLSVSFEAPLSSLGAPEDPQNAEDEARIEAVLEDFRNDETIISLQGDAGCEIVSTSTGTRLVSGHGEMQLDYDFDCENAGGLEGVRFGGFDQYPALLSIEAVFVSDTQQMATELSAASPELKIQ